MMGQDFNPLPAIERVVMDVHHAHWDNERRRDEAKLTGWCGYEAWARVLRHVSMLHMDLHKAATASQAFKMWGCELDKDPGQPVDDIVFQSNGAPVRRLNTRTMQVDIITGPPGVLAREIKDLQAVFRGDYAITVERPFGLSVSLPHLPYLSPSMSAEPAFVMTRSWNMQDFIDKGLVFKKDKRTYSLTLAGRNAIAQFNAFPA